MNHLPGKITLLVTWNPICEVLNVVEQTYKGTLIVENLYELPYPVISEFSDQVNNPLMKGTNSIITNP